MKSRQVSPQDRRIFAKLARVLNPAVVPVTQEERCRQVDFVAYLNFIDEARGLPQTARARRSSEETVAHQCYQRAKRLGLLHEKAG